MTTANTTCATKNTQEQIHRRLKLSMPSNSKPFPVSIHARSETTQNTTALIRKNPEDDCCFLLTRLLAAVELILWKMKGRKGKYHTKYCTVHTLLKATKSIVSMVMAWLALRRRIQLTVTSMRSCGTKAMSEAVRGDALAVVEEESSMS